MNHSLIKTIVAFFFLNFYVAGFAQLFWKISGNGLVTPSYLFGTHHLIDKSQIVDYDKIIARIDSVDAEVGEMDMTNMLGLQMKMAKAAIMKDIALDNLISENDYKIVAESFDSVVGVSMEKLKRMKPAMLSALYEVKLYMNATESKKEPAPADLEFQKRAKKLKKEIIGLETIDQQMGILFDSVPLREQADDLVQTVKNKQNSIADIQKLTNDYLSGNLDALNELSINEDQMTDAEKKLLIYDRNNNWVEQFKSLLPHKSCFIAVGCLHLTGEQGLIQQLRNLGYVVTPVEL
ncbi:MAG: TraB/GumN family protein [Paludibacter sp.]|nr:TraB/GumN family protein [Paludibacter sp.]